MVQKPARKTQVKRRKPPARASARNRQDGLRTFRGILPTPPEVAELVEREVKGRPITKEARQRVTDWFNLQYYFGGNAFAYRKTPHGLEVLAVGLDDIGKLLDTCPAEERLNIVTSYVEPW